MKQRMAYLCCFFLALSCNNAETENKQRYGWFIKGFESLEEIQPEEMLIETFGDGNTNNCHQSLAIEKNRVFCINSGDLCSVYNYNTFEKITDSFLPEWSHHNNAQFSATYYSNQDKYPLLFISQGNYPPNTNPVFVVRIIEEDNNVFTYGIVKTIHNNIDESQYNGSWIIDDDNKKLYLYTLSCGDFRVKENNYFHIYQFDLPDILNREISDYYLTEDDVTNKWSFPYLVHQGGTCYKGKLIFNVQSLSCFREERVDWWLSAIIFNPLNGELEAILPLDETLETEGISVYKDKLHISYKNGLDENPYDLVIFKIMRYNLPNSIFEES